MLENVSYRYKIPAALTLAIVLTEVGTVIAHRLASTTFFCCDTFRTGAAAVNALSQMRG
jgi:hypothetical protein